MSGANIVHSGYGLRCEKLDKPLNLGWGLDNSAVLHWPGELPTGWLCDALDQIFIAAPQLSAVVLPWSEWCEEPQALTLFGQVQSDIIHRSAFWQLPLWLSSPANRASGEMVFDAEREIYFPQRPPRPQGEVYRRYDPRIRRMLSFRIADPVSDAERFTRWMNDPRVEYFWEQSGSLEVQIAYLERQLTSKHAFPLIGCSTIGRSVISKSTGRRKTALVATIRGSPLTVACICWLVNSNGAEPTMCKAGCAG